MEDVGVKSLRWAIIGVYVSVVALLVSTVLSVWVLAVTKYDTDRSRCFDALQNVISMNDHLVSYYRAPRDYPAPFSSGDFSTAYRSASHACERRDLLGDRLERDGKVSRLYGQVVDHISGLSEDTSMLPELERSITFGALVDLEGELHDAQTDLLDRRMPLFPIIDSLYRE